VLAASDFVLFLLNSGNALLVVGLVFALAATLPDYEGRSAAITTGGLIVSGVGAAVRLIGTAADQWPHADSPWNVASLVFLSAVPVAIYFVLRRPAAILQAADRKKRGDQKNPKDVEGREDLGCQAVAERGRERERDGEGKPR
jgi:hypothetical protein